MHLEVDVPPYEPGEPFRFTWDTRPLLAVSCDGLYVSVAADKHGLRALAVALLALAGEDVPDDTEVLLDGWVGMTGDVPHLLLRRAEAGEE